MDERPDLLTAFEACRPDSDDLAAPELAELADAIGSDPSVARQFESLQRWDASLRTALHQQGDVPVGLEARLLAALEEDADLPPVAPAPAAPPRLSRRRWWSGMAAAATLAAVAVGAAMWSVMDGSGPLTQSEIQESAVAWCDTLGATEWRTSRPPVDNFPFAAEVRRDPDAWQPIALPDSVGRGVAYRLPPPPGSGVRRMTLLVLKADAVGLGMLPPRSPYKTMDHLVATWQIGENVYVLVLLGDDLGTLQDIYNRSVNTSGSFT